MGVAGATSELIKNANNRSSSMIIHQPSMEDLREILIEGKKTPMDIKKTTVIIKPRKSEAVAGWEQ